jgi:hypothetical protein
MGKDNIAGRFTQVFLGSDRDLRGPGTGADDLLFEQPHIEQGEAHCGNDLAASLLDFVRTLACHLQWGDCNMRQNSPAKLLRRAALALMTFLGIYVLTAAATLGLFGGAV